jgi:hypothetical protein
MTLIFDFAVPTKPKGLQGAEHLVTAAGDDTGGVEVFHAKEPASAGLACIKEATDRCNQGP